MSSTYICGPSGLFVPPTIQRPIPVVIGIVITWPSPELSKIGDEFPDCRSAGNPESTVISDVILCCSSLYLGDLSGELVSLRFAWRLLPVAFRLSCTPSRRRLLLSAGVSTGPATINSKSCYFKAFKTTSTITIQCNIMFEWEQLFVGREALRDNI